jgi:hypothetical protein
MTFRSPRPRTALPIAPKAEPARRTPPRRGGAGRRPARGAPSSPCGSSPSSATSRVATAALARGAHAPRRAQHRRGPRPRSTSSRRSAARRSPSSAARPTCATTGCDIAREVRRARHGAHHDHRRPGMTPERPRGEGGGHPERSVSVDAPRGDARLAAGRAGERGARPWRPSPTSGGGHPGEPTRRSHAPRCADRAPCRHCSSPRACTPGRCR